MKKKISDKKANGFTIIELIIVISILGVIDAIAIPRLTVFKNLAEEKVCNANRKTVEKAYKAFFLDKDVDSESAFNQFLNENFDDICPVDGVISHEDGIVKCSVHEDVSKSDRSEPPGDEVPWL